MGKFIDLTGQKIGKWTVVEHIGTNKFRRATWLCRCECGSEKVIDSGTLINRKSFSCGCDKKVKNQKLNLAGKKFNRLTVVEEVGENNHKNVLWKCICDCGNEIVLKASVIVNGYTKSCGCLQKERASESSFIDLSGMRFGKLVAQRVVGKNKFGQYLWECKCDCGNVAIVNRMYLRDGSTSSCGCVKSVGEQKIQSWLEKNNIAFEKEKRFEECKYKTYLPFDFYLCSLNICIEYDGIQHYEDSRLYSSKVKLSERKKIDDIKTQYCKEHGIKLLRIPYWEKDNIESILSEWLNIDCVEEANSSNASLSA